MRISIIGLPGSGKSFLAKKISKKLNIPHLHIDRFWFESKGHLLDPNDLKGKENVRKIIREKVENFIKQGQWVSDGWYSRVQQDIANRADQVIFLDISIARRLFNHLQRILFDKRHRELKTWDEIKFFPEIIRRTFTYTPKIKRFIKENPNKIIIFKNYKKLEEYINNL